MRINVKKILFIGSKSTLDHFFERAQKIGWFQFTSVSAQKVHTVPKRIEDLKRAIKELRKQPVSKSPVAVPFQEVPNIVDRILVLKHEIENLHEEMRMVKGEIAKMHPLGHFDLAELHSLEKEINKTIRFYFNRHEKHNHEEIPHNLIYLDHEYDFDYYMLIDTKPLEQNGFVEIPIKKSLGEWQDELIRLNKLSHESEAELKELAAYLECLEDYLVHEMNLINLNFSKEDVDYCMDEHLFSIDAWVPSNRLKQIERLVEGFPIAYREIAPDEGEQIPTYLENHGLSEVGQDLVEIYDTPSNKEKDPSKWVLWSFAIFFGMIISDAGYGLLFLLFSLFLWSKVPKMKSRLGKRVVKLVTLLSCTSIVWGVMIASYFSIKFAPNSVVNRFSILHYLAVNKIEYHIKHGDKIYLEWVHQYPEISNTLTPEVVLETPQKSKDGKIKYAIMDQMYDAILMEIALLVGVIHLSLSFLRNLKHHWAGIGWVATLIGGYLYFPNVIDATSLVQYLGWMSPHATSVVGQQLLYGGLAVSLVLALIQEKLGGLATIFKVIEVFADSLSYLRLYALGLASMVMAATFNDMAMSAGFVGGFLILLGGHLVNMGLGTAAGVIHGLRLNFLEWYHHCYEGGGKKFNPLRLIIRE